MSTSNQRFGDYLAEKRKDKEYTVRGIASELGISATYYSDVENHRRKGFPPDTLDKLPCILGLTNDEKYTLFYLAGLEKGEISHDIVDYVLSEPYIQQALRLAKEMDMAENEWKEMVMQLQRRRE